MFLTCERSVGKSLVDHLLRDSSRLEKGVQLARRGRAWAINPGGLCCDRITYKPDFRLWSRSIFVWGYLDLMWAVIHLGLLNGDVGPKTIVPTASTEEKTNSEYFRYQR